MAKTKKDAKGNAGTLREYGTRPAGSPRRYPQARSTSGTKDSTTSKGMRTAKAAFKKMNRRDPRTR